MNRKTRTFLLVAAVGLLSVPAACGFYHSSARRAAISRKESRSMEKETLLRDGDIIFQTSLSPQSKAIQKATRSEYSHCGIIYRDEGGYKVFEAMQPVKSTPLKQWTARGAGGRYTVKRLADADSILTSANLSNMRKEAKRFAGKDYDLLFSWSDDRIYCSELVWKIYRRALGIELGALESLGNFDLSAKEVREKLSERYGENPPLSEPVISPAAIYDCRLLTTVAER